MKLSSFVCVLFGVFSFTTSAIADERQDGFFVDGSIGSASPAKGWSRESALAVEGGYRWSWFALEAGYVDFERAGASADLLWGHFTGRYKLGGFTAGASGRWNMTSNLYATVRAGAFFWHNQFDDVSSTPTEKYRDNGTSWRAGVGLGYDVTKNVSLGLNYVRYDADRATIGVPSFTAEVRF